LKDEVTVVIQRKITPQGRMKAFTGFCLGLLTFRQKLSKIKMRVCPTLLNKVKIFRVSGYI
jgi:hypothetical protein